MAIQRRKEARRVLEDADDNDDSNKLEDGGHLESKTEVPKTGALKGASVLNFPFSITKRLKEQSTNLKMHNDPMNPEEVLEMYMSRFSALTPDSIARQMTLNEIMLIRNIKVVYKFCR